MPGIYRRGNRYVVTFTDPAGRRLKRAATTMAEARLLKASLAADVARGDYRELSRLRFDEYARDWLAAYQGRTGRGIRPTTLAEYRRHLEAEALPFFGSRRLAEIELRHVKAFAVKLAGRGLAPATVRKHVAPVRALFATAVEEGLIRINPCTGLRLPGQPVFDGSEPSRRALTEAELAALIAETPPEWRLLIRFLVQTGLRSGEFLALRWDDIDLGLRRVKVRRRLYLGTLDAPKSRYGIRDVPISRDLAQELWRHRAASAHNGDLDPVFASRAGTPLNRENLFTRVVKPAARRAGVPWAGLHTLRHTCASMLFRAGWNAKQVQTVLGHHSPAFTLATYVHLVPEDLPEPAFSAAVRGAAFEGRGEDMSEALPVSSPRR